MTLGSDFLKYALPPEKKRLIGHDFGLTFAGSCTILLEQQMKFFGWLSNYDIIMILFIYVCYHVFCFSLVV